MPKETPIEWTRTYFADGCFEPGYSSNPIYALTLDDETRGWHCPKFDESCDDCYAERINRRLGTKLDFSPENTKLVKFVASEREFDALRDLNRRLAAKNKTAKCFIGDMLDLFQPAISLDLHARLWETVEDCPNIIFQVLTKVVTRLELSLINYFSPELEHARLPRNLWLGFSAPNQEKFDVRWRQMRQLARFTKFDVAVVFLSYEPALGQLVLPQDFLSRQNRAWVIAGGESGHRTRVRPSHPDWFRSVRDACAKTGVPFFFKQFGEWQPVDQSDEPVKSGTREYIFPDGTICLRLGKKKAGRRLDGREYNEFPQTDEAEVISHEQYQRFGKAVN